jgi:hypothetical protein
VGAAGTAEGVAEGLVVVPVGGVSVVVGFGTPAGALAVTGVAGGFGAL